VPRHPATPGRIGSTIERHQHPNKQPAATAGNGESGESGGESSSEGSTGHLEKSHGEAAVKILGVNIQSRRALGVNEQ
jgi:hypothetical protein